jgi:hypothetical protein
MKVRDKEHQSLGIKELLELCEDYPNDSSLGLAIREMVKQTQRYMYPDPYDNDEYSKSHEEDSRAKGTWRQGTIWQ